MSEINNEFQFTPKNLINQLKDNIEEINALKEKIESLENKISSLNNKIFDLKIQNKILSEIDAKNKGILEEKKNCENKIEQLKTEILNVTKKEKSQKRSIETELENEVNFYKGLHESGLGKVHAAERIINLNNFQNDYIAHLEKEIQKLRSNNNETISKLELDHDIHFYNLKQKMTKYVKDVQHSAAAIYKNNLEYNSRLNILYKNQMLNELEREALLIKELIISKEKYEKKIFVLNQDLQLYKEVNKDLIDKNNKYMNIIKSIKMKYPIDIIISNGPSGETIQDMTLSEKKKKKFNEYKMNYLKKEEAEDIKEKQEQITENIIKNNLYRECMTTKNYNFDKINKKYFDEYISLKKLYEELYKENIFIKEQYSTLKEKQKMLYNKFNGILNLYKEALTLLMQDEDLKLNNISLNKEIILQGNYDNFTSFEKYIIVMLLIKNLLPLIETSIEDNDDSNEIFKSFLNFGFKTTSNTFNFEKKEEKNISKLSRLNFRSLFDKRIDICDSNIIDFTQRTKNNLGKSKNKSLKSFNSESNIIDIKNRKKILNIIKNNSFNENKRFKIFKTIKGKYRPLRFIHIENKFNFNIKKSGKDKDISLTKNNFFD